MTQLEIGGRFIRSGFWMLLFGMVMSFGMVGHYIVGARSAHRQSILENITLWYACPWTLSTAVVLGGALGMIAVGAVYAILGRTASPVRVEGLEKSALSLCTVALIAMFLTGYLGYFRGRSHLAELLSQPDRGWQERLAADAARLHGRVCDRHTPRIQRYSPQQSRNDLKLGADRGRRCSPQQPRAIRLNGRKLLAAKRLPE